MHTSLVVKLIDPGSYELEVVVLKVCGSVLYCYGRTLSIVHCLDEETTILCMYLIADPQNNNQTACKPSHLTDSDTT
jgi:hypothetical protein